LIVYLTGCKHFKISKAPKKGVSNLVFFSLKKSVSY